MIAKRITAMFGILLLAAAVVAAQAAKLEGAWEGKMDHEGVMETITFNLHAKGAALTGKVLKNGSELGDVSEAKVNGNKVHFKVDFLVFEGSLEGDHLNMTVTVYNGNKFSVSASKIKPGA